VAHRMAWGLVSVAIWVTLRGRWADARAVASRPATVLRLAGSGALISLNWLLYIWAVINDHVVEASLGYFINPLVNVLLGVLVLRERLGRAGYFINPLVNVLLGVLVLRERLGRAQWIAVALATAGVAVLALWHGRLPWIALALAVSFGLYGLARKTVGADAVVGLLWETALVTPLAAGYLVVFGQRGSGAFGVSDLATSALLALGGAVTAVPLVLFTVGARALPLSAVGFLQYLSPSLQFLLAVLVFREPFTPAHAAAFAFIWTALAILTWDLRRRLRQVGAAA
jgi:chloramphenicol-sensitive protein RarD